MSPYAQPLKRNTLALLSLIVLSSLAVGLFKLTRDNGWGDDFAGYIMQAASIVEGTTHEFVEHNTFTMEQSSFATGPIAKPWGFPLLLAPVYAVFGLKILPLKAVLTICFALFLIVFFLLARETLTETGSLVLTAAMAFNPTLLFGQSEVLPDIPATLFSTLCLLLISRWPAHDRSRRGDLLHGMLIGLAVFATFFVRWSGISLLAPLAAIQILAGRQGIKEGKRPTEIALLAGIPYATFGLLWGLETLLLPGDSYPLAAKLAAVSEQSVSSNLVGYFWLPGDFLINPVVSGEFIYLGLLVFFAASLIVRQIRCIPLHVYILTTVGLYVLYPSGPETRWFYPVVPVFLLLCFDGMGRFAQWLKPGTQRGLVLLFYGLWAILTVAWFAASATSAWENMAANRNTPGRYWGAFSPGSTQMFDFVRHHTPADSVIIFQKPLAMRLRTTRDSFFTLDCSDLGKGNYVVTVKDSGTYNQISPTEVRTCNPAVSLTPVYDKDDFIVYRISPRP